jgi:hypothetical protein
MSKQANIANLKTEIKVWAEEIAAAELVVWNLLKEHGKAPTKVNRSKYIDAVRQLKSLRAEAWETIFG